MREVVLDRFFIDNDKLWIIDFKTFSNKESVSNNLTTTMNTCLNFIRIIQFTVVFTI